MRENEGKITAIIVAGGKGSRMSLPVPKQYHKLLGRPLLAYTVERFENCEAVDEIILVAGQGSIAFCHEEIVARHGFRKVKKIVPGGDDRQASVYHGLQAADPTAFVLVHDGVRPFVTIQNILDVIRETKSVGCCVLGVPAKDTIKICAPDLTVQATPDRKTLWLAQTPQGFRFDWLLAAHEQAARSDCTATDDASLMEQMGHTVKVVPGSYGNIKITTDEDWMLCRWLVEQTAQDGETPYIYL